MIILSLRNIEDKKYEFIPFTGRWYDLFGKTEFTGNWIVYGKSGKGKTSFCLQLAKELDEMGKRVMFISLEMRDTYEFQEALKKVGISSQINKILVSSACTLKDLDDLLSKQRSPDVIFFDSLQYFIDMNKLKKTDFIELRNKYEKKVFVYISHMKGNEVEGDTAYDVKKDAFKRVYVNNFKAIYTARGEGGPKGYYVVWEKGYNRYWLKQENNKASSSVLVESNFSNQQACY